MYRRKGKGRRSNKRKRRSKVKRITGYAKSRGGYRL